MLQVLKSQSDIELFVLLKQEVVNTFLKEHSAVQENVLIWSGQEILIFQEDLQEKVHTSISEKWFYTYFKKEKVEKLPRIDMLNLLSQYAGFSSWNVFKNFQRIKEEELEGSNNWSKKWLWSLPILMLVIILVYNFYPRTYSYRFCFEDQDLSMPITAPLHITLLREEESPIYLETAENGCFSVETDAKVLRFVVQSPYYQTDTIVRHYAKSSLDEKLRLSADEYALILKYFSTNNVEDWNNRRNELEKMIHPKAVIYQVFGNEMHGIDVLTKDAFINKITLPTSSLRNMKILEIERDKQQIVKLKFEILI